MATYELPTPEENERRRAEWREVIRGRPTWQLEIWLDSSRMAGEWDQSMIREELEKRKPCAKE